ncbi:MAG: ABC transporter permease [Bacteroidota bacterium]
MSNKEQNHIAPSPPRLFLRFFYWFCHPSLHVYIEGDLLELYQERVKKIGKRKADWRFAFDVLLLFRPGIIRPLNRKQPLNHTAMFRNYLKVGIRNLVKHKGLATINTAGLALGITCSLIIFLFLRFELSFDRFLTKGEQLYRVVSIFTNENEPDYNANTPYPLASAIRTDFSELTGVTQIHYSFSELITVGNKRYKESNVIYVDSLFLNVFNYDWISGDPTSALSQPNSVVLTETLATKYFKGEEVLGKVIELDSSIFLKVTGLIKDVPKNTHLPFSALISFSNYTNNDLNRWDYINHGMTYIVLPSNVRIEQLANRLPDFFSKYMGADQAKQRSFQLQPIYDIRFDMRFANTNPTDTISKKTLWVLAGIGLLIVLIACVNFMNLTTAQVIKRAREVGLRKVIGGNNRQVIVQFLVQTLLLTSIALLLSILITALLIPRINSFLGFSELYFNVDRYLILFLLIIVTVVGISSGLYPAIVLARYDPIVALKNNISSITKRRSYFSLGKSTVIFQFITAQVFIIGTMVISQQMKYFHQKDLGFTKENIVNFYLPSNDIDKQKLTSVRNELLRSAHISAVSFSKGAPTSGDIGFGTVLSVEGREGFKVLVKPTDAYYQKTYGLNLLAGQWLPAGEVKDGLYPCVINEASMRKAGYQQPEEALGQQIKVWLWAPLEGTIVGVVKDFHITSLKEKINPLVMMNIPIGYSQAGVKLSGRNIQEILPYIEKVFETAFPKSLFSYNFLDESIAKQYEREVKINVLFTIFASMAIFIACLGLLGLSSYAATRRTKEVGIRKVSGASVAQIVLLLCKEFAFLVLIAFVIAAPLAWYMMNTWLDNFAYHIQIELGTIGIACFITLLIALLTTSFHATKAALSNPINSLKSE